MNRYLQTLGVLASLALLSFGAGAAETANDPPVAITPDGGRYWGPLVDGQRQGLGRIEWANGARYEGGFEAGLFTGKGRLRLGSGDAYEGEFVQGLQAGTGTLKMASGAEYSGQFRDGVPEGRGHLRYENGAVYEGEFRKGLPHGTGKVVASSFDYEGEFQLGEMWGSGEFKHRSGRAYKGEFAHGDFQGKGRLTYPNGAVYEGDFAEGEFTGNGSITYANGARQEGRYVDWELEGPGRYFDGQGNTYEGNFKEGRLVGTATVRAKDGSYYVGEVNNWMPQGQGELHLANGDVYRGAFEYGMYEGEGTLTYAKPQSDGRTQDAGTWQYGRLKKADEERQRRARANAELALYSQGERLDRALRELMPRDPQAINMYLLVVAGDGSQEVFRREAEFVRSQFDTQFGTRGRSIALINSQAATETNPLATVTSVRRAIRAMGEAMDRERDILFLYVTSHGSKEQGISLSPQGMQLPELSGPALGTMLKEAGIRWKVVAISACHAAGMFDGIRDPGTLMIAAARADRKSFGCADENDFTYFGRAYFKEALPTTNSFEDAFVTANRLITEWEDRDISKEQAAAAKPGKEALDAHSLPQMEAPEAIREQLGRWRAQHSVVARGGGAS